MMRFSLSVVSVLGTEAGELEEDEEEEEEDDDDDELDDDRNDMLL